MSHVNKTMKVHGGICITFYESLCVFNIWNHSPLHIFLYTTQFKQYLFFILSEIFVITLKTISSSKVT